MFHTEFIIKKGWGVVFQKISEKTRINSESAMWELCGQGICILLPHSILINISRGPYYAVDLLPFGHLHLSFERYDGSIL